LFAESSPAHFLTQISGFVLDVKIRLLLWALQMLIEFDRFITFCLAVDYIFSPTFVKQNPDQTPLIIVFIAFLDNNISKIA
jgi:hypothetical protein